MRLKYFNHFKEALFFLSLYLFSLTAAGQDKFDFYFGTEAKWDSYVSGDRNPGSTQTKPVRWVNVNTDKETWKVVDSLLIDSGDPVGVVRSEHPYENFLLHVEWMHLDPGGNSGIFVWSDGTKQPTTPYPSGVEVQMLDSNWVDLHERNGVLPPIAYVNGELFGVGKTSITPDNPRGKRSKAIENRIKGTKQWNVYDLVCIDGVIKLAVNGKFVNGISQSTTKRGYLCLEAEGGEIHFKNLRIIELPPGVTYPEQSVPTLEIDK